MVKLTAHAGDRVRSRRLSETQISELAKAGIRRDFYTVEILNGWYRSFLKACATKDQGQLSRDRFCKLIRAYVHGQGKKTISQLDTLSNQLFDAFEFPDQIDAHVVEKEENGKSTKCLVQERFDGDEPDGWKPRILCPQDSGDGQIMFIDFTRFMVVMTQIMDLIPAGRNKLSSCRDMRIEWMFKMIVGRNTWKMKEESWVDIHEWIRTLNNEEFGERQRRVVRQDFGHMLRIGYATATFLDFQKHLDRRPHNT
ncbi:uncharacterized protein LOC134183399 isoform X2 [Corticium candelabrum]|uniref:uncharacterized protein LOC134183399 isoform X2 n=1 Tax=Corticium candelabrum TaxID=121492 RepID=UPI002E2569EA|nr:uncharacterized protein LOC134183399 isoform X2 [Corticium candelabrum]